MLISATKLSRHEYFSFQSKEKLFITKATMDAVDQIAPHNARTTVEHRPAGQWVFADTVSDVDDRDVPSTNTDKSMMGKMTNMTERVRRRCYVALFVTFLVIVVAVIAVTVRSSSERLLSPNQIEAFLRQESFAGGVEFEDPSTYQYHALQWNKNNPVSSEIRLLQRYALVCLYYSTYEANNRWLQVNKAGDDLFTWDSSRGWLTYNDECDWYGVGCDDQNMVTDLDLDKNDLTGKLPPEVAHLANSLISLNIESNFFYNRGEEETNFFGKLTNLRYLYMKDTLVQNEGIPTSFGLLTNLRELDCSYSLLHGPLHPQVFENLHDLKYLEISGNSIEGPLPSTLTALPRLKYFYAVQSDLQAVDLDFLIGMPSIIETWLDRNPNLTGSIPASIGTVSTLESLSVTRCGLTGAIPTQLGLLTDMQQMWLYRNNLFGTIPTELGFLTDLRTLEMEGNNLTGNLPDQICSLKGQDPQDEIKSTGSLEQVHTDCVDKVQCSCCDCCGPACSEDVVP